MPTGSVPFAFRTDGYGSVKKTSTRSKAPGVGAHGMDVRVVYLLSVAIALALAGCTNDTTPTASVTADETAEDHGTSDSGEAPGEPRVPEHPTGFVQNQGMFSFDGEAPAGIWVCGVPAPGGCAAHVLSDEAYIHRIPHEGNVSALTLTVTFEPATPNIAELNVMIHAGSASDGPLIAQVQGPSPLVLNAQELDVPADVPLTFVTWPPPDISAPARVWVNPIAQGFHVDGSLMQTVALH